MKGRRRKGIVRDGYIYIYIKRNRGRKRARRVTWGGEEEYAGYESQASNIEMSYCSWCTIRSNMERGREIDRKKKKSKRRKIRTGSTKAPLLISNASLPKISYGETLKVEREKKKRKRKRRIVRVEKGKPLDDFATRRGRPSWGTSEGGRELY